MQLDKSSNGSNGSDHSEGTAPTTKSSSTLNSLYGTSTPSSSIQPNQSTPNLVASKSTASIAALPQRPMPLSSVSNRSSFIVGRNISEAVLLTVWLNDADVYSSRD